MKNILIICGGISEEHSISIVSAKNIIKNIDKSIFKIHILGINKNGNWQYYDNEVFYKEPEDKSIANYSLAKTDKEIVINFGKKHPLNIKDKEYLSPLEIDIIFPIVHGRFGEDGVLQGVLETLKIPYLGTNVLSSAMGMEKDITKLLAKNIGIPTADWELVNTVKNKTKIDLPVFVKPVDSGSSIGISKLTDINNLESAIKEALKYSDSVLIEKAIKNPKELELAVLGNYKDPKNIIISGVGEILVDGFYDFEEKYNPNSTVKTLIPSKINENIKTNLQKYAKNIFIALKAKGMMRVDFLLSENEEIFFNEVNTHPGFTRISMYPSLMEESGITYKYLIEKMIELV